jgi:hypothetical protein
MKTAVEWLAEQMLWNEFHNPYLEQAKEMEKEKLILAHLNGQSEFDKGAYRQEVINNAEKYYNETFKQQEQVKKELTSEEIPESFFKPVLGEPIWNIRTKQFKQQEQ